MLIEKDPYNAFIDYPDAAVTHAPDGPLAGLTFAVKDIFDVASYPTGCGNPDRRAESENDLPQAHAPVVEVLLAAGARFVGKTHTAEFAFSLDGRNEHFGTPENPAAPGRVPGGSSSGSVSAVAGGLVDIALGSDTGGSVRGPASMCGLIGLRTSFGRIDIGGTMPLSPGFDTVGWFARSAEIYARVGAVLLGEDAAGPALSRMIVAEDSFALLNGEAEAKALKPAVAKVGEHLQSAGSQAIAPDGLSAWADVFRTIQGFEAWQSHGTWIESRKPKLTPPVGGRFKVVREIGAEDYLAAGTQRKAIREHLASLVKNDCVIVLPTLPTIAPLLNSEESEFEDFRTRALQMLCAAGLSGFPQISLPLASVDNCPIGLSLLGPPGRDRALIELAGKIIGG